MYMTVYSVPEFNTPILFDEGRGDIQMEIFNMITCFTNHLLHKIFTINTDDIEEEGYTIELDSHANSPVVVSHSHIIRRMGKRVSLSVFTND